MVILNRGQQPSPADRALRRTPAGWLAVAVSFAVSAVAPGMPLSEATVLAWLTAVRNRLLPSARSRPASGLRRRD